MDADVQPKFDRALAVVLRHEGGFVDDPTDPGGVTNFGIAHNAHPELTIDDIRHLTRTQAGAIYRKQYWDQIRADELPFPLALCTFDAGVMSGVRHAVQWLQRVVEVDDDGRVGPQTIAAAHECELSAACSAYTDTRLAFLRTLATWPRFGKGWESRCVDTLRAALS